MRMILEGVARITTSIEFDMLMNHIDVLIGEATEGGYFSDIDESNEYTREIARLGKIGARYEDEFLNLSINGSHTESKKQEKFLNIENRHRFLNEVHSEEFVF